jgi:hypothetical protein
MDLHMYVYVHIHVYIIDIYLSTRILMYIENKDAHY